MAKTVKLGADALDVLQVAPASAAPVRDAQRAADAPQRHSRIPDPPPWMEGHPKLKTGYPLRLTERRLLQLKWLAANTPQSSVQKILDEAIEREVERRLREFGGEHGSA